MNARTAGVAVAALSTLLWSLGCHRATPPSAAPAAAPLHVRARAAEARPRVETEEVVGIVRPKLQATLQPKMSGRIEEIHATPGQAVKTGDLLVRLDDREVQSRLDQALTLRDQLARDTARQAVLLTNRTISPQEYEAVESRYLFAKAAVTEAESAREYARIVAPFDGVVMRKLADLGDLAAPGRPLLEIADPRALRFEADVPGAFIGRLRGGQAMPVRVDNVTGELTGVVDEIAPEADPNSLTFQVKLDLPANSDLRAGQFGRVLVPAGNTTALCVPAAAVVTRGGMEMVFVVLNNRAQLRLVKTGRRIGADLELLSGVNAGEQVVIENSATLLDGQPVEVNP